MSLWVGRYFCLPTAYQGSGQWNTMCVSDGCWSFKEEKLIQPQQIFFLFFLPLKKQTCDPVVPSSHLSKALTDILSLASRAMLLKQI